MVEPKTLSQLLRKNRDLSEQWHRTNPSAALIKDAKAFLTEVAATGRYIVDIERRERLSSITSYWASILRMVTGELILPPYIEATDYSLDRRAEEQEALEEAVIQFCARIEIAAIQAGFNTDQIKGMVIKVQQVAQEVKYI